jgi:hypothetical protein
MCSTCIAEPAPPSTASGAARTLPSIGTLVFALMPKFGCPLCWPILAATLGLFGVRVQGLNSIFIAVAAATVTIALILLRRAQHDRTPFILLAISSTLVLAYRLALVPAIAAYTAAALITAFLVLRHLQRFTQQAPSDSR